MQAGTRLSTFPCFFSAPCRRGPCDYGSPQKPEAFVWALCMPGLTEACFRRSGIHKAHVSDAHVGFLVAERTRFELVIRVFAYDGLANRWFQPLTHLSGNCIPSRDSLTDSPNRNANIKRNFGITKFYLESVCFLFFSHACGIGLT